VLCCAVLCCAVLCCAVLCRAVPCRAVPSLAPLSAALQGAPSTTGTGSLFLPEGAVGVFDLPSTWAVIQKQGLAGPPPMIDT
jgi:hypothetical protein